MFGRKKDEAAASTAKPEEETTPTQGKNAPTPKRSAQQASRQRPLVPTDRKLAREAQRKERTAAQDRLRLANETGDERYMMPRDRGEQKRLARDHVDSRWMVGEFLMIAIFAFLIIALAFPKLTVVQANLTLGLWVVLGITLIDAYIMTRRLKKQINERYGDVERGVLWYATMRSLQFRKIRLPKPQVKRGEAPR